MNPLKSEPVVTVGAIMALMYILVAFGLPISENQQRVMQDQLPIVLPAFIAFIAAIRQMVYAPDSAEQIAAVNVERGYTAAITGQDEPAPTLTGPP